MASVWGFDTLRDRVRVRGDLVVKTSLRVGKGRDLDVVGNDLPVMRDAQGRPFIPGSSLKGVLRAEAEALLRSLSSDTTVQRERLACMVLVPEERCIPDKVIEKWRDDLNPFEIADEVLAHSCRACQTFGSTWLASHVAVRDLPVREAFWFGQFEVRTGVSLDRDTGTAREGQLYSFETVPPGTRFNLEIEADNLQDWQKGLLWLVLQPFVRGEARLGGARSRGLGEVELDKPIWEHWERGADRPASVIELLSNGLVAYDPNTLPEKVWRDALVAQLKEVVGA